MKLSYASALWFCLSSSALINAHAVPAENPVSALPLGVTSVQVPNPAYNQDILFAQGLYYVGDKLTPHSGGWDGPHKRGTCYGFAIGDGCCIGVYCGKKRDLEGNDNHARDISTVDGPEANATEQDFVPAPLEYNVAVHDGYTLESLVVHPDGTYDAVATKPGELGKRYTCIGVKIGDCCVGVCIGGGGADHLAV